MKNWKKVALLGVTTIAAVSLAACSSNSNSGSKSSKDNVTLWVDATQVPMYKPVVQKFEKKYPNINVKLTQSPTGSSNAKTDVGKDPSKAANVFEVPHDQLGQMEQAGYINPLSPTSEKYVKDNDVQEAVDGVTYKGKMYAYPFAEQSKILFYNKSKLSADDVKSFETLTSKGTVAMTITDAANGSAYTMLPAFTTNGLQLYGENGEDLSGINFNTDAGTQVMNWIASLKSNKGVVDASTAAINDLKSGKADAYLDGPWDSAAIKKALGDNMAVAAYPTVDFGSGPKDLQAFTGIETFAVNSKGSSSEQRASVTLAEYLTNKETQLTVYKKQNQIPVNKEAQTSSIVKNDPMAQATFTMVKRNVMMPKLPQMANMWNLAAPLIAGAYNGTIPAAQYPTKLQKFDTNATKK